MNPDPTDFRTLLHMLQREHEWLLGQVRQNPADADALLAHADAVLEQIDRVQNQALLQLTPEISDALSNVGKARAALDLAQQQNAQAKVVLDRVTDLLKVVNGVLDLAKVV